MPETSAGSDQRVFFGRTQPLRQQLAGAPQQLVAACVACRVVDLLEMVDVDQDHADARTVAARKQDLARERLLVGAAALGQAAVRTVGAAFERMKAAARRLVARPPRRSDG